MADENEQDSGSGQHGYGWFPGTENPGSQISHCEGQGSTNSEESEHLSLDVVKQEKISRNCKRFNRLFHAEGEDSSSLDEPVSSFAIKGSRPSSSSAASQIVNIKQGNLDPEVEVTLSSLELKVQDEKGGPEIVLEIEIQGYEDGIPPLSPVFLKTEDLPTPQSVDEFEDEDTSDIHENDNKLLPGSLWNPGLFGKNLTTGANVDVNQDTLSNMKIEDLLEGDEDDDEDGKEETKRKKPIMKVKRERNDFSVGERRSSRLGPKTTFCNKKQEAQLMKRVKVILKKELGDLTFDEHQILEGFPAVVDIVKKRLETRMLASERLKEFEDSPEVLDDKCTQLAEVLEKAQYLVVYTGAGISTSAQIPDYRGPNGIWTLLKNGQSLDSQNPVVLTTADPTITHMTVKELYNQGIAKHIVSQNCDGLHIRSGIPKNALSEVHGNMYVEVCLKCSREYVRLFDVTENTRRHEHRTGRSCYHCASELRDTVVHFGERGSLRWPLNWAGAEYNVNRADVILCLGSSLKVLRRYPWLWGMDKPACKRPKLFIVNLQWTPKDQYAALKIHGKCDEVMSLVMRKLNIPIPSYERDTDPIFAIATPLHSSELHLKSNRELTFPDDVPFPEKRNDISNYIRYEPEFRTSSPQETGKTSPTGSAKKKAGKKRKILKGNGNGWLGNAWGVKPKKRKLK